MIDFHQVKKLYTGNDFVLGELNFTINEGEFVFLIGPSGSGKTTLIRLLIREEAPSTGRIFFDDYDITNLSRSNVYRLRRQIGVIFQDYKLINDKNAYENVAFAMEAAGRTDKEIKETVPYVLDIVGLSHRMKAFPSQLSGGEKQRVAIARAVANNPRVLIADEPTGNLDPAAAWDIVQILSKINNWGTTVIMSTHGTDIVNSLSKRVIQMERGNIVRDDNKGRYEVMEKAHAKAEGSEHPVDKAPAAKKGPIKVKIQSTPTAPEVKPKEGFFSRFSFSRKAKTDDYKPQPEPEVEEELEQAVPMLEAEAVSERQAKKIVHDANRTSVSELKLRPEIIADLEVAGYHDIEDVLSAGPDKLGKELIIDPEEVVQVAQALSDYIAKEEQKMGVKVEPKAEPKAESEQEEEMVDAEPVEEEAPRKRVEPDPKILNKKRVKISLTGKK